MFYTYSQNNSGGNFEGVNYIVIEAASASEANAIAESRTPIYFDGCDSGIDCSCCGDRWCRADEGAGTAVPSYYGKPLPKPADAREWLKEQMLSDENIGMFGMDTDVYYLDGRVDQIRFTDKDFADAMEAKKAVTPSVFGFRYYSTWPEPTEVVQAWQSDYDSNRYWDSSGNLELTVNSATQQLGWYRPKDGIGSEIITFTAATRKEADDARSAFMKVLEAARDAARTAVSEALTSSDLPTVPKNFFEKVYRG